MALRFHQMKSRDISGLMTEEIPLQLTH